VQPPPPPLLLLPLASDSVLRVHSIILKYLSTPTAGVVFIAAAAALYNNILSSAVPASAVEPENKLSPRGQRDDMPPADGSSTRGGSTSVRGRIHSPRNAKPQAASVPIA